MVAAVMIVKCHNSPGLAVIYCRYLYDRECPSIGQQTHTNNVHLIFRISMALSLLDRCSPQGPSPVVAVAVDCFTEAPIMTGYGSRNGDP